MSDERWPYWVYECESCGGLHNDICRIDDCPGCLMQGERIEVCPASEVKRYREALEKIAEYPDDYFTADTSEQLLDCFADCARTALRQEGE